ncbi:MAG TPA: multicopper oxidase domain-containing protein [Thermoplasmata archaeon]|nr:multicopper oxidase domain-containing protein [Thermoplasmata archaeon]
MIHIAESSEPKKRNLATIGIGIALAALVLSASVLTLTLFAAAPSGTAPRTVEARIIISSVEPHNESMAMMMEEMHVYMPSSIVVNRGDTVILTIVNMDEHRHGFAIPDLNIRTDNTVDIAPLDEVTLTFVADRSGVFMWECNVPYEPPAGMAEQECGEDHDDMQGYLVVR